jgi:hypothetical protein
MNEIQSAFQGNIWRCLYLGSIALALHTQATAQGETASNTDLAGFVDPSSTGAKVDKATGAFSFSLPLINIPGAAGEAYPIVLGYAPPNPEEAASWVGFGWTLGPGAITRNASGIPDDFNGIKIVNIDKKPVYQKLTLDAILGAEILSAVNLGLRNGIALDNQRGILPRMGFNLSGFGAGISYMNEAGDGLFSFSFNPVVAIEGVVGSISKSPSTPKDRPEGVFRNFGKKAGSRISSLSLSPQTFGLPTYSNGASEVRFSGNFSLEYAALPNIGPEAGFNASITQMTYAPYEEIDVYGYMFSGELTLDSKESTMAAMDFFEERPHALDENDRFTPLPVQTPDHFSVAAGSLGGQFRCFFSKPGSFHPRGVEFSSTSSDFGIELGLGAGLPTVLNAVVGASKSRDLTSEVDLRSWMAEDNGNTFSFPTEKDRRFFAFKGDLGLRRKILGDGDVIRGVNADNWNGLDAETYYGKDATKHRTLELTTSISGTTDANWRPELMKTVRWNDARTMDDASSGHRQFDRRNYANAPANFVDYSTVPEETLSEFEILNESGTRYTFGIPVFERNKLDLSYRVDADAHDIINHNVIFCPTPDVDLILKGDETSVTDGLEGFDLVQGKLISEPVATSWLLTAITSPDYIDVLDDGCTDDDLGSWVRFKYKRLFGSMDKSDGSADWFRFRDPVAGSHFHSGSVGDTEDDMASFSLGEKEVYILERIETRTHYAEFTTSGRTDGARIADFNAAGTVRDGSQWGTSQLERLDNVNLFAKDQSGSGGPDKLLKSVSFNYDYTSWQATYEEGSISGTATGGGKLTLNGVTIEENEVEEDTKHFSFGYEYPTTNPLGSPAVPMLESQHLSDKYDGLFLEYAGLNESPSYRYGITDAWGSHQNWEEDHWSRYHKWRRVNAGTLVDSDPAAHCLKQIIIPSGTRILPQYEQHEYRHVQNRLGEVMVPLDLNVTSSHDKLYLDTDFLVDVSGLGWDITDDNGNGVQDEIAEALSDQLVGNRVFTKVLFQMSGTASTDPKDENGWNYFPAFVNVEAVGTDANGLFIEIEESGNYSLPQDACWDFYQKYPRVSIGGLSSIDLGNGGDALMSDIARVLDEAASADNQLFGSGWPGVICNIYDPAESYVRIPLLGGAHKIGGGLRVKRLMVYDPGIEDGSNIEGALLTGTEFGYEVWNNNLDKWVSSGVAANEPRAMYEECALFEPLAKEPQTDLERALGGEDNETQTGPVGGSFLPSPGISYEEVTERSIHDDLSGEGETVHRFYSHKTHPTIIEFTDPSRSQLDILKPNNPLNSLFSIVTRKGLWYSQGVRVTTSDMPGKQAETVMYGAERDREGVRVPVSRTTYQYFEPGESVNTLDGWNEGMKDFGVFDEVYFMGKFIRNHKVNLQFEADMDVSISLTPIAVPVVFGVPSFFPWGSIMTEVQGVHATVMQSHRPAMIQSITTEQTGMESVVKNMRYDEETGRPLLTSITDGFSDVAFDPEGDATELEPFASRKLDLQLSGLPWYDEMGKASKNDRLSMTTGEGRLEPVAQILSEHESITFGSATADLYFLEFCPKAGKSLCGILGEDGLFYPGDLLELEGTPSSGTGTVRTFWYVESVDGNRAYVQPSEKLGSVHTFDVEKVDIVRSGRSNQLGTSIAQILTYDEDLDVTITPNPAAAPFHNLVAYLNANAIPAISNSITTRTTNIASGSWEEVRIEEAGCSQMMDPSVGLSSFHMEFHGNSSCGTGYISFPNPTNITTTTTTTTVTTTNNQYSTPGVTDGNSNGDSSPNGRVVNLAGQVVIPIHFAPASEGGPGEFRFDPKLGAVVWTSPDAECSPTVVFTACQDFSDIVSIPNVMSGRANGFNDLVDKPKADYYGGTPLFPNNYEFGEAGRWSLERTFTFNSTASSYLDGTPHSTQVGLMQDFTAPSPYHLDYSPDQWIQTVLHLELDERGRTIESEDAFGHGHAMRYNHLENRPIWAADGGRQNSCSFESFENIQLTSTYGNVLTDSDMPTSSMQGQRSNDEAHSGQHSWRFNLVSNCTRAILQKVTLDEKTVAQGIRIRFWAHEPVKTGGMKNYAMNDLFTVGLHASNPSPPSCSSPSTLDLTVEADSLAQTGKWVLMEAMFQPEELGAAFAIDQVLYPLIQCNRGPGSPQNFIYLDDVRVQPKQAVMTCSVFDPQDFRLLTNFDGNHFGTYLQYNHKGELIRTQVETEAGMKTVSETQEHILEN